MRAQPSRVTCTWIAALALALAAGCGDSGGAGGSGGGAATGGSGGGNAELPPLDPPDVGMQLASTPVTLMPGEESYYCWSFEVPAGQPLNVTGIQPQTPSKGVHHFAAFTNTVSKTEDGPYECSTMGVGWGLISGGGVGTNPVDFPQGTAMPLPEKQHVILQLHMLNATGEPLDVGKTYVNLKGTDAPDFQRVGLLIAGTLDITVPPQSTDVQVSGSCQLAFPLEHVFATFPHMHQLGRRITTELTPASGPVVTVSDEEWNFQDQGLYPTEGSAQAGDTVKVTCHYDNPTDKQVDFGLHSSDEMCVNVLYYYPATEPPTYCGIQ